MPPKIFQFQNFTFPLELQNKKETGVSRSSYNLSQILPNLSSLEILDVGCGIGYMTIGALYLKAKSITALDIENVKEIVYKNARINNFSTRKITFLKSDLFSKLPHKKKFDVIIANLPQHALPAVPRAKMLRGKYGGYDGTDIVCRGLAEGSYYLKRRGRYFGSISELTNFRRTINIAKTLYRIKVHSSIYKELKRNEMMPYLTDEALLQHLQKLKRRKLIKYIYNKRTKTIRYRTYRCEFILKDYT